MDKITVRKINETYMEIDADSGLLFEIKDHFTFEVPGAKYSPKFKAKVWDGTISLLSLPSCYMYIGLLSKLKSFCKSRDYELIIDPNLIKKDVISPEDVFTFVKSLNIHSDGNPLQVRDYQLSTIYSGIVNKRHTFLSPTSSGKSLIIYCLIRWILDVEPSRSILLIVPNIGLVRQMYGDFLDYSSHNGFDVAAITQTISEGATKVINSNLVISTWQSIFKEDKKWVNQFDGILVDEVHLSQASSIRGIMEKATDVPYKIGLTGTLSDSKTHEMVIEGLFGKIVKVTTTSDLIEKGHISNIDIKCIVLEYNDKSEQKAVKGADYHAEMAYICAHAKRNNFIKNLALKSSGNTLVLYNYVESHGKILYDLIKSEVDENRKVFFIHGKVDGEERDEMRKIVEKENDAIIVASFGTLSTGTSIKRLNNIIAASSTKSIIRILQSIGRGLRKAHDKDSFIWYDIVDDFSGGTKKKNYGYVHFIKRLQIYTEQQFKYSINKFKF